jgi:hypothetical protein
VKVHFVRNDLEKRMFWVSASKTEAEQYIFPLLTKEKVEESLKAFADEDDISYDGSSHFMIAEDLSIIDPFFGVFPVSNMWNGGNPWCRFGVEITDFQSLANLDTSKTISCYSDRAFEDEYCIHLSGATHDEIEKRWNENFPTIPFVRESSR